MVEMCLEALISGVIAVTSINPVYDPNNRITYVSDHRQEFVVANKYSEEALSKQERFAKNKVPVFDLIKTTGD
jgi:hypothetical protein